MNFVPRPRFFMNPPRYPWPHPMMMLPPPINTRYPSQRRSKTKSISERPPQSFSSSGQLPKAHSWHAMARPRPGNFSVAYAHEMHLTPKPRRKRSRKRKKRPLPSSPKRRPSFRAPPPLPERGVVRISTFDELPLRINPRYKRKNSATTDRMSAKGSVTTNSMKGRTRPTKRTNTKEQERTRPEKKNRTPSSSSSSSISTFNSSLSSAQRRLNGSLRNDPLLSAAMEDFRRFRRQSESSDSTVHSPAVSRSHSQSSFTSVERCEIRQLIEKMKTTESTSVERPVSPPPPIPPAPPSERSVAIYSRRSVPISKPRKSSLTEELDREFSKLRSLDPDQELTYVIPSAISKRKKPIEIPPPAEPPLPTFSEMLRKVQLRPIEKASISKPQIKVESYRSPVPVVPVPQSSPTPPYEPPPPPMEEVKHEYARPMKKPPVENGLVQISHFQPMCRSKSSSATAPDKRQPRMINWFHGGTDHHPIPVTFQPSRSLHPHSTSVNENIYTPDITVPLPLMHEEEQRSLTNYYYSESDLKDTGVTKTSFFRDLTRVFSHKHEQKIRLRRKTSTSRCSLM